MHVDTVNVVAPFSYSVQFASCTGGHCLVQEVYNAQCVAVSIVDTRLSHLCVQCVVELHDHAL
jgi:hypothetical protein